MICVRVLKVNNRVIIIINDIGKRLIGEFAKNQIDINPLNTIYRIRIIIRRKFNDIVLPLLWRQFFIILKKIKFQIDQKS